MAPGGGRHLPPTARIRSGQVALMPSCWQGAAGALPHSSGGVAWPSSITVLTLFLVITCGVSSADLTSRLPLGSFTLPVASAFAAAVSPLARAAVSLAAESASCLIGL